MKSVSALKSEASQLIAEALLEAYPDLSENGPTLDQIRSQTVYSDDFKLAHLAFPCHPLAKRVRTAPVKISGTVAALIEKKKRWNLLVSVQSVNGYLNFFCDVVKVYRSIFNQFQLGHLNKGPLLPEKEREKILVEYSQPNTHKALHVGHLRNMIYGDAVCNLLAHLGHHVVRATYPGDLGTHIAKSLWYILKFKSSEIPENHKAAWLGRIYAEAADYIQSKTGSPEETEIKTEVADVLRELEAQSGRHYELYRVTRQWSLDQMHEVYDWLGIHFDVWYYESECDQPSRHLVQQKFEEGFFVKSQGAIGIDLSAEDLGFVLFLKSDGTGLYITKDLELFRRKLEDFHVQRSIVVVDSRQKLHFKQLFKTAEKIGYAQADQSVHLSYESVTDEDGKPCSSRNLTGVQLDDLRGIINEKVRSQYLESYRGVWTDEEIEETGKQVALGALKYGFLKVDATRMIRFVLDEWIQLEGDTGPYLQYAFARCASIGEKQGLPSASSSFEPVLKTEVEQELLLFLERFDETVLNAGIEYRPSVLSNYLFALAKLFNRFYKECPIKTAESAAIKETRLGLVVLVAHTLRTGLKLLGIATPNRL